MFCLDYHAPTVAVVGLDRFLPTNLSPEGIRSSDSTSPSIVVGLRIDRKLPIEYQGVGVGEKDTPTPSIKPAEFSSRTSESSY